MEGDERREARAGLGRGGGGGVLLHRTIPSLVSEFILTARGRGVAQTGFVLV